MRIARSARRHGIDDEDILHALRNAIRSFDVDEVTMLIGPARDGTLLELGVVELDEDDPAVIHAMRLRPKFYPLLG